MANTGIEHGDSSSGSRTMYRQKLTLGGVPVTGTTTTTYIRGNNTGERAYQGMATIGTLLDLATGGQVLNVEITKITGLDSFIGGGNTAITIVKLPGIAETIDLTNVKPTGGQDVNAGTVASPTPITFDNQVSISARFSHTSPGSAVTVNEDGGYLFLSSLRVNDVLPDRVVPQHGFRVDGTGGMLAYGQGAEYNRSDNDSEDDSGSWSGVLLDLTGTQTVEMVSAQLGAGGAANADELRLIGISIDSLIPSEDPTIASNNPLPLLQNATGTITSALLNTLDATVPAQTLTYTVTSNPAGGTLRRDGTVLTDAAPDNTFTQDDIDAGLLTFEAAGTEGVSFGFDFEVSDGVIASPPTGTFTVVVGEPTSIVADSGSTDEDTAIDTTNVLANDVGTSLNGTSFSGSDVLTFDALSANGAAISHDGDGTFHYDPTGSAILQTLDDGATPVNDTFTYTVTDFQGNNSVGTVTITVGGVNDAPVTTDDDFTISNRDSISLNVLANDVDVDLPADTLTLAEIESIPTPATFTTAKGAVVTVFTNGSVTYDATTSPTFLALAPGITDSESLTYTISDGDTTSTGTLTVTVVGTSGAVADLATVNASGGVLDPGDDPPVTISGLSNDNVTSGAVSVPTGGAVIDLVASTVGNTDSSWVNIGSGGDLVMDPGSTLVTNPSNAPPGIAAVYAFSGTNSGSEFDAPPNSSAGEPFGTATTISDGDATFEFVFRPADQNGDVVIFDSGGSSTGMCLVLLDNLLVFTVGEGANEAGQATATLPPSAVAGGDFVHVVGIFDDAADEVRLYVNNVLADTGPGINYDTGSFTDLAGWGGTGGASLGSSENGGDGGNIAPLGTLGSIDLPSVAHFEGEFAVARVYGSALSPAEISDNFGAIFGSTSAAAAPADVVDLDGVDTTGAGPIFSDTLTSGAIVTYDKNTGLFTYDPNGAFNGLGLGLSAVDTFTYSLNTTYQAQATVAVTVLGTATQSIDTEVTLVGDVLTITDTVGNDNAFRLSIVGAELVIGENTTGLIEDLTGIGGVTGDGTNELRVPLSGFTGIEVVGAGGSDSVALEGLFDLASGPLTIDAESISSSGGITNATNVAFTGTTTFAAGAGVTASGTVDFNGDTIVSDGFAVDSSAGNGDVTFNGALLAGESSVAPVFHAGSGDVSLEGDVGTSSVPFTGYTNLGSGLVTFEPGNVAHTGSGRTVFTGPGAFLVLGTLGETPPLIGPEANLFATSDATVTFGDSGNAATLNVTDGPGGSEAVETANGGRFDFINLSAPVIFNGSIRNASGSGDGTIVIGDGTAGGAPTLDFVGGNIETAGSGTGVGRFEFLSGTVNLNSNNFITGQADATQAGTPDDPVTIGGGSVEAHLNLNATGAGDWNTNGGTGYAEILGNGRVTADDLNLGSSDGEIDDGLNLTIDGGILELTGNIDYRTDQNGNNDQITLISGVLDGNVNDDTDGNIFLRNSGATAFDFQGGTLKAFASFDQSMTQKGGTLQVGSDSSNGSAMAIIGDYDLNAGGTLELTLGEIEILESDVLNVSDDLTLAGDLSLVTGVGYNTTPAAEDGILTLVTYGGTLTGEFANYTDGQEIIIDGTDVYRIDYGSGSNSAITLTFLRDDDTTPPVSSLSPADGAIGVLVDSDLVLTFDEDVYPVTGGGEIRLVETGVGLVETWSFTGGLPTGITIVGNVVTIDPAADLDSLTDYHIEVSGPSNTLGNLNPVFENVLELGFVGTVDAGSWNFTTVNTGAPLVTIDQATGQDDPTSETSIDFTAVFSEEMTPGEFAADDLDFSGTTAPGTLSALITTSDNITYNVAVSGMTGDGNVVVSVENEAATAAVGGLASAPSTSTDNSVSYIVNFAPSAAPLTQTVVSPDLSAASDLGLEPILVSDANSAGETSIDTTVSVPFINYPVGNGTGASGLDSTDSFDSADPVNGQGFALEVIFTPELADVADGTGVGSENRRVVFEIGGSSNGSGIYLIDGVPYFISKIGGLNNVEQDPLANGNDIVFDNGGVHVRLSPTKLTAGESASIAIIFSFSNLSYSVNGAPVTNQPLTGSGANTNWSGNDSVRIGISAGPGGIADSSSGPGTFVSGNFQSLSGADPVASAKLWNDSSVTTTIDAVRTTDEFTVTLTITNGAGHGTLSASQNTGSANIQGNGTTTLTISGTRTDVNLALAAVTYTGGASTGELEQIDVSIDDGDEDGSGPFAVTVTLATAQASLFVDDDFAGTPGDPIPDADSGTTGNQAATFGLTGFPSLGEALVRAAPGATIVLNAGNYNESATLIGTQTLEITGPDVAASVTIANLNTEAGTTVDIEGGSTLVIGDSWTVAGAITNISGTGALDVPSGTTLRLGNGGASGSAAAATFTNDGTIVFNRSDNVEVNAGAFSGTGGLTHAGTGELILLGTQTCTGTTTVNTNTGNLRIGNSTTSGRLADGALLVVNDTVSFQPAGGDTVVHNGVISGSGQVITNDTGTTEFTADNTFSGGFRLGNGLANAAGDGSAGGVIIVSHNNALGSGPINSRGGQLRAGVPGIVLPNDVNVNSGGFRVGGTEDIEITGTTTIEVDNTRAIGIYGNNGISLALNDLVLSGSLSVEGTSGAAQGDLIVGGNITGASNINLLSAFDNGALICQGANNTYTGTTTVAPDTTLVLDGTHTNGGLVTVNGTLAGNGSTDADVVVNASGALSPGTSIGTLSLGNLDLNGTLNIEVDSLGSHDAISVTGTVDLTSATLNFTSLSGDPVNFIGSGFLVIVDNDNDDDPVTPIFGIDDDATLFTDFLDSGRSATISYDGAIGGDNDVVIAVSDLTALGQWRLDNFGDPSLTADAGLLLDVESGGSDGLVNLIEFAFGTDPNISDNANLFIDEAGDTLTAGTQITDVAYAGGGDPFSFTGRFVRLKDFASVGLTYTPQFSDNPGGPWEDSSEMPSPVNYDETSTPVESVDGNYEVVEVPYVQFLSNGQKARFFRVLISFDGSSSGTVGFEP